MALPRLDVLPGELLLAISYTLDTSHKQSVANFSLVNKACRSAAAPALFRLLTIRVETPRRLADDVQRWTHVLLANDSFKSVRQLAISGDVYRHLRSYTNEHKSHDNSSQAESFLSEKPWLPLAHLIEKLPGLKDLYFHCHTTLPPCILRPLFSISVCRLHITDFSLEGLQQPSSSDLTEPLELSANDLELITSSLLYAIAFSSSSSIATTSRRVDYTPEAIFEVVARACPALREVEIVQQRSKAFPSAKPKRPYPGLKLDQQAYPLTKLPDAKAKLASLALRGRQPHLQQWLQHTEFDCLQVLRLTGTMDLSVLDWVAESLHFPSLSTLEIETVQAPGEDDETRTTKVLESLPGLKELTIIGLWTVRTLKAISNQHGITLQRLSLLDRTCSLDEIRMFRDACPYLKHLAITIPRMQGNGNEVAIYKELGSNTQIQSLVLNLDCTSTADCDESIVTQRTFINCALDNMLAASIFDHIAGAKLSGSAPLESVELNVVNATDAVSRESWGGQQERARVYCHFTRRWICSKHPRDDWRGGAIAVEHEASRLAREHSESMGDQPPKLGELEKAFRALWPQETSHDWRDDWSGFPLQS
jgi:hypothetical protein